MTVREDLYPYIQDTPYTAHSQSRPFALKQIFNSREPVNPRIFHSPQKFSSSIQHLGHNPHNTPSFPRKRESSLAGGQQKNTKETLIGTNWEATND